MTHDEAHKFYKMWMMGVPLEYKHSDSTIWLKATTLKSRLERGGLDGSYLYRYVNKIPTYIRLQDIDFRVKQQSE